ncbi:MAG: DUF4097 family beta strand repeat-containing protein [Bryobacteraceae bacterium]
MKNAIIISALLTFGAALGQESSGDRVTVPFSDASRPRMLKVSLVNGGITVKGYEGKDVIIEARSRGSERRRNVPKKAEGMHRIDVGSYGLTAEEQDNVVRVSTSPGRGDVDLVIQVPVSTSLQLRAVNGGAINVEHVTGEIDVDNVNGPVKLLNVSGVVVAHALNGEVQVVLDQIQAGKPMSFSSLNGDIDVTLPADAKARVKMKSDHGDVFSDFDITLAPSTGSALEEGTSGKGKYRVRLDKTVYGTINGGGPEMQFTTLNGRIYIRKKK